MVRYLWRSQQGQLGMMDCHDSACGLPCQCLLETLESGEAAFPSTAYPSYL